MAPFGVFKPSGKGREWGEQAFAILTALEAVRGYTPPLPPLPPPPKAA
jgi:acyl-CoA reductase-like NAD-dependent aldehyde dehydrogenase